MRYLAGLRRLIESWLDQCPYLRGPNWTSSLELGIRLINWSLVWQLIGGAESPLFRGEPGAGSAIVGARRFSAFAFHCRPLFALFIRQQSFDRRNSGTVHRRNDLAVWPQAVHWRTQARRELVREALEQNTPDGVNLEQAISYQQFVLDFLLLAGVAGRVSGDEFPVAYGRASRRCASFSAPLWMCGAMCR